MSAVLDFLVVMAWWIGVSVAALLGATVLGFALRWWDERRWHGVEVAAADRIALHPFYSRRWPVARTVEELDRLFELDWSE